MAVSLSHALPDASLRVDNVCKECSMGTKSVVALDHVSLEIAGTTFMGVVGRSGSGKSTLLNLLAGLDRPSAGAVWFGDQNLAELGPAGLARHRREMVGIVFQSFYLIPTMTALQNVALALAFAGVPASPRRRRAAELLDLVGLADRADHRPSELSGGEQQRVAIARAMANSPRFLLADEPTGNLDSRTAEEIFGLLKQLHQEGRTIICITHEKDLIEQYADRLITLKDGRIVETTDKLTN
ncbi:MAG: ABC transporter ATP-binding protein [Acidobacteria bacterium]|nr:MAG: ABC transporter ATP-binding protein [Acidobacteriota bacterium]